MSATSEIRTLLETRTKLLQAKDAEALTALYEPGAPMFELPPPLAYAIHPKHTPAGYRQWFATWKSGVGYKTKDFVIEPNGKDFALAYGFIHMTGTRADGTKTNDWFRQTLALRKSKAGWRIAHQHTSAPFAMDGSDRVLLNLKPKKLRR